MYASRFALGFAGQGGAPVRENDSGYITGDYAKAKRISTMNYGE
jgi:hypothetical protein